MLGASVLVDGALSGAAHNPWKKWTDYLLKHGKQYGFRQLALVRFDGQHLASSTGVIATENDVKVRKR